MNRCPSCEVTGRLTLTRVLAARPAGSFTLSGAQDKTTATVAARLSCAGCGWHATGRVHDLQVAGDGTITGGHLIIDQPFERATGTVPGPPLLGRAGPAGRGERPGGVPVPGPGLGHHQAHRLTAGYPVCRVDIAWLVGLAALIRVETAHLDRVGLGVPILIAPVPDLGDLVIDGWHRVHRALRDGITVLPAKMLTPADEAQIRIRPAGNPHR